MALTTWADTRDRLLAADDATFLDLLKESKAWPSEWRDRLSDVLVWRGLWAESLDLACTLVNCPDAGGAGGDSGGSSQRLTTAMYAAKDRVNDGRKAMADDVRQALSRDEQDAVLRVLGREAGADPAATIRDQITEAWALKHYGRMPAAMLAVAANRLYGGALPPGALDAWKDATQRGIEPPKGSPLHDAWLKRAPLSPEETKAGWQAYHKAVTATLEGMHARTQAFLAEHGITEVTVYRGDGVPHDEGRPLKASEADATAVTLMPRPLSSFTTRPEDALVFAAQDPDMMSNTHEQPYGRIARVTVPASAVVSLPMTGLGNLHEREVILKAGRREAVAWGGAKGALRKQLKATAQFRLSMDLGCTYVNCPEGEPGDFGNTPTTHPKVNERGGTHVIDRPSIPTDKATWHDKDAAATFVPAGKTPDDLNGVAIAPWTDAPKTLAEWAKVEGQRPIDEPPTKGVVGSGVVIVEDDGRVWLTQPSNQFGGYVHTLPKGQLERGLSPQANAIKEAFEETGLKVEITGHAGDVMKSRGPVRFYTAKRVGGTPSAMGWETQGLRLAPKGTATAVLNDVDGKTVAKHLSWTTTAQEIDLARRAQAFEWNGRRYARQPTDLEYRILSLAEIPDTLDRETMRLSDAIRSIRRQQLDVLCRQLAAMDARPTGPLTDLRPDNFDVPLFADLLRTIRDSQRSIVQFGATQLRLELIRQGLALPLHLDRRDALRLDGHVDVPVCATCGHQLDVFLLGCTCINCPENCGSEKDKQHALSSLKKKSLLGNAGAAAKLKTYIDKFGLTPAQQAKLDAMTPERAQALAEAKAAKKAAKGDDSLSSGTAGSAVKAFVDNAVTTALPPSGKLTKEQAQVQAKLGNFNASAAAHIPASLNDGFSAPSLVCKDLMDQVNFATYHGESETQMEPAELVFVAGYIQHMGNDAGLLAPLATGFSEITSKFDVDETGMFAVGLSVIGGQVVLSKDYVADKHGNAKHDSVPIEPLSGEAPVGNNPGVPTKNASMVDHSQMAVATAASQGIVGPQPGSTIHVQADLGQPLPSTVYDHKQDITKASKAEMAAADQALSSNLPAFTTAAAVKATARDVIGTMVSQQHSRAELIEAAKFCYISSPESLSQSQLADALVSQFIGGWNGTSTGSTSAAIMQHVVAEEFGGIESGGMFEWRHFEKHIAKATPERLEAVKPIMRSFIRAQYAHTQAYLEAHNVEYVTVYRGQGVVQKEHPDDGAQVVRLQPMSSAATKYGEAKNFVPGTTPYTKTLPKEHDKTQTETVTTRPVMLITRLHRSRILSTHRTGAGVTGEHELTILGGRVAATILNGADAHTGSAKIWAKHADTMHHVAHLAQWNDALWLRRYEADPANDDLWSPDLHGSDWIKTTASFPFDDPGDTWTADQLVVHLMATMDLTREEAEDLYVVRFRRMQDTTDDDDWADVECPSCGSMRDPVSLGCTYVNCPDGAGATERDHQDRGTSSQSRVPTGEHLLKNGEPIPGPLGSQGGKWRRDPATGREYLVKPAHSREHAMNEVAGMYVYEAAGLVRGRDIPHTAWSQDSKGRVSIISEKLPVESHHGQLTPAEQTQAIEHFGVDALLSHWDVYGMVGDNTLRGPNGPVRIESGGAMSYRAMGDPKPSFSPTAEWVEPRTIRTGEQGQQLYGRMTDAQAADSLEKAGKLNIDAVAKRWRDDVGVPAKQVDKWVATIKARQAQIPMLVAKLRSGQKSLATDFDWTPFDGCDDLWGYTSEKAMGWYDGVVDLAQPPASHSARPSTSMLVTSAQLLAKRLGDAWLIAVLETGARLRRVGVQGVQLEQAVWAALEPMVGSEVFRHVKAEVNEAFQLGRNVEVNRLFREQKIGMAHLAKGSEVDPAELIDYVVQSAVMDALTCEECAAVDGEEMEYGSSRQQELEPPYQQCLGKDNCRCVQMFIMKDRRDPVGPDWQEPEDVEEASPATKAKAKAVAAVFEDIPGAVDPDDLEDLDPDELEELVEIVEKAKSPKTKKLAVDALARFDMTTCPECGDVKNLACSCVNCPENCTDETSRQASVARLEKRAASGSKSAAAKLAATGRGSATGETSSVGTTPTARTPKAEKAKPDVPEQVVVGPVVSPSVPQEGLTEAQTELATRPIKEAREIDGGVNTTKIVTFADGTQGVFKPVEGEHYSTKPSVVAGPGRGALLAEREVMSHEIDQLLGTRMSPPVTLREHDGEVGSVAAFIPNAVDPTKFAGDPMAAASNDDKVKMTVLDIAIGNCDRTPVRNYMIDKDSGKLHAIDHGFAFPTAHDGDLLGIAEFKTPFTDSLKPMSPETQKALGDQLKGTNWEAWAKSSKLSPAETTAFLGRIDLLTHLVSTNTLHAAFVNAPHVGKSGKVKERMSIRGRDGKPVKADFKWFPGTKKGGKA